MTILKGNFPVPEIKPEPEQENEYRNKALESIAGSMVFVEGAPLYWDLLNDE